MSGPLCNLPAPLPSTHPSGVVTAPSPSPLPSLPLPPHDLARAPLFPGRPLAAFPTPHDNYTLEFDVRELYASESSSEDDYRRISSAVEALDTSPPLPWNLVVVVRLGVRPFAWPVQPQLLRRALWVHEGVVWSSALPCMVFPRVQPPPPPSSSRGVVVSTAFVFPCVQPSTHAHTPPHLPPPPLLLPR